MEGLWAKTCDGDEFIVYNNEDNDNMLILGTQLYLLSQCKLILMDGTFRCVPKRPKFKQLYAIHGEINGKIFPLLYSLLPSMKSKTYEKLFCVIKRRAEHQDLHTHKQYIRKTMDKKTIIALPLIPLQYLDEAWLLLIEDAPNNQNVTLLLDYIVETL